MTYNPQIHGFLECVRQHELQALGTTACRKLDLFKSSGDWAERPSTFVPLEGAKLSY